MNQTFQATHIYAPGDRRIPIYLSIALHPDNSTFNSESGLGRVQKYWLEYMPIKFISSAFSFFCI